MKWVLLYAVIAAAPDGNVGDVIHNYRDEFDSKTRCEYALSQIDAMHDDTINTIIVRACIKIGS